jgi:hypothetical protein
MTRDRFVFSFRSGAPLILATRAQSVQSARWHRTRLKQMNKIGGTKAERLRAALRENLRRRKLQAKGRSPSKKTLGDQPSTPLDTAEIGTEKRNR